jgi:ribonuclease HI
LTVSTSLVIYADGGSRGNPGPAAIGVVILDRSGKILRETARRVGRATNNQAEYLALIEGLKLAREMGAEEVSVQMDSELVVRQVNGRYALRSPSLRPLFQQVRELQASFRSFTITHVPRAHNRRADALLNQALNRGATPGARPSPP